MGARGSCPGEKNFYRVPIIETQGVFVHRHGYNIEKIVKTWSFPIVYVLYYIMIYTAHIKVK